jgi:hypothetical protein
MAKTPQKTIFNFTKNSLGKFAEAGVPVQLIMPDGTDTGGVIMVRGDQSPICKAHVRNAFQERQMRENVFIGKGQKALPLTLEELEEMTLEAAVVAVISWEGIALNDDTETAFSQAAARQLFEEDHYKNLVLEASRDASRFCGK